MIEKVHKFSILTALAILVSFLIFFILNKEKTKSSVYKNFRITNTQTDSSNQIENLLKSAKPISDLLNTKAGQFSNVTLTDSLNQIRSSKGKYKNLISNLRTSKELKHKLLGYYLELENSENNEKLLNEAISENLPLIALTIADWLFINQKFDQWENFVLNYSKQLSPIKFQKILSLIESSEITNSLPATFSYLNIGQSKIETISAIAQRFSSAGLTIAAIFKNPKTTAQHKDKLLPILKIVDKTLYLETVNQLKISAAKNSHTYEHYNYLLVNNDQSKIFHKAVDQFENSKNDAITYQSINVIINSLMENNSLTIDKLILEKSRNFLGNLPHKTQKIDRKIADLSYLIWRQEKQL